MLFGAGVENLPGKLIQRVKGTFTTSAKADTPGLEILSDQTKGNNAIDIVAVHGLARGFQSWTWGGKAKSWLKHPFPDDVGNARIITFSYNPEALSIEFLVRKILYGRALDLVQCLKELRTATSTTRRPLVFIAHSLGGLIVKRALIVSNEAVDRDLRDIELSTSGIVFFGTPDSCVSSKSLEEIIRNIARLSPSQKALEKEDDESIRCDTKWFEKEMEAFKPISSKINIISFYENVKTSFARTSFHSSLIVSEETVQNSSFRGPPHDANKFPLQKRHTGLVKFDGKDDPGYERFKWHLKDKILDKAREVADAKWEKYDEAIRALSEDSRSSYLREDFSIPSVIPHGPNMLTRLDLAEELSQRLSSSEGDSHIATVTLFGNPGVGKTTLVRHYSLLPKESRLFVFWFNAESRETIITGFLELAQKMIAYYWDKCHPGDHQDPGKAKARLRAELGLPDVEKMLHVKDAKQLEPIKVRSVIKGVKDWLLRKDNRWLLVYDNVDNSFDLLEFIPVTLQGQIILITQDRDHCSWGTSEMHVPDWDENAAIKLLLELSGVDISPTSFEDSYAGNIVQTLRRRPLSISCAASHIRERCLSLNEYWKSLSSQLSLFGDFTGVEKRLAKGILRIGAMLSFHAIPVELFSGVFIDQTPSKENNIALEDFKDRQAVNGVLERLTEGNVVQRIPQNEITYSDDSQSPSSFLFYGFARDRVKEELIVTKEQKASSAWSACYFCVQAIKKHDESDDPLPEIQSFGRLMLPHARACYRLEHLLDKHSRSTIKWQVLGNLCMTQGANDIAIGCFTLALQCSVTMDNIERTQTTLSLASLHHQRNNLKECKKLLSDIDLSWVRAKAPGLEFRVQLATAAESAAEGDLEGAKETYDKLEKEQETYAGPIDYNTVLAVHQLAATLKALGKLEESQALYRRAFTSYKMLLGQNDPITLEVAEELAQILQLRGAFSGAEAMYKLCINTKKIALGPDHPSTAASIARLATLLDLKCEFEHAEQEYQNALRIMGDSLGECHPLTVTTMEDRALSYRMRSWYAEGDDRKEAALKESARLYEKVLEIKKESGNRYSKEQIESSEAKFAEMKENEEFFRRPSAPHPI